jgi:hypothetical protein
MSSEQLAFVPGGNVAVRLQGRENRSFETFLAMDENALMLAKLAQQIRLDLMFLISV